MPLSYKRAVQVTSGSEAPDLQQAQIAVPIHSSARVKWQCLHNLNMCDLLSKITL